MKNTFGQSVTLTLFGESHGPAVGAVLDGSRRVCRSTRNSCAANWPAAAPRRAMDTPRREPDNYQILSGVWQGRTTGTPLTIVIPNENTRAATIPTVLRAPRTRTTPPTVSTTALRTGAAADTSPAASPRRSSRRARLC